MDISNRVNTHSAVHTPYFSLSFCSCDITLPISSFIYLSSLLNFISLGCQWTFFPLFIVERPTKIRKSNLVNSTYWRRGLCDAKPEMSCFDIVKLPYKILQDKGYSGPILKICVATLVKRLHLLHMFMHLFVWKT